MAGFEPKGLGRSTGISFHEFFDHDHVSALFPRDGLCQQLVRVLKTMAYRDLVPDTPSMVNILRSMPSFRNLPERWNLALDQFAKQVWMNDLELFRQVDSSDGETSRVLSKTRSDLPVESVIMRHRFNTFNSDSNQASHAGRSTVCLSTQSGCALGCRFCATGSLGGGTNLSSGEIVSQAWTAAGLLAREGRRLRNIVFMGMGEPLLNISALKAAIDVFASHQGFSIAKRRITVSTAGIVPGIMQIAREIPGIGLAISLHAPNDNLRQHLMPIAHRWPLSELMDAVGFFEMQNKTSVVYEYLMLKDINDQACHADQLITLLASHRAEVNLIPWNPVQSQTQYNFSPSDSATIISFKEKLKTAGIPTTIRYTMGSDINAACGQLALRDSAPNKGSSIIQPYAQSMKK